jgi:hypothetical protein
MEQPHNEGSELASGEGADAPAPSPPAGSTSVKQLEGDEAQRVPPSRRKLSDEQQRELTRLYADTTMHVSEIARTLGIGKSSVAKPPETPSTPAVAGAPARVRPRDASRQGQGTS